MTSSGTIEGINVRVDPQLIRKATDGHYMNALAFFYILKSQFNNSRIYKVNNPYQRMADATGVSLQTAKKYLSQLTFRGLVTIDSGAIILAPTPQGKYRTRIHITPGSRLQHVKYLLYGKTLEQSGRQQSIKHSLEKFLTGDGTEQSNYDKQIHGDTYAPLLSVRNISTLCNISTNTARSLIRDLNRALVIRTTQSDAAFLFYADPSALSHLEGYAGYRYYMNGSLREIQPAQHLFLQHPITYKPVTSKSYDKLMKDKKLRQFAYRLKLTNIQ